MNSAFWPNCTVFQLIHLPESCIQTTGANGRFWLTIAEYIKLPITLSVRSSVDVLIGEHGH